MNLEIEALNRNNTWEITDLPDDRKPVGCKWIYRIKYKANGDIEWFKARLVTKGYSKKEGIDYEETFSPVVKHVTSRSDYSLYIKNIDGVFIALLVYVDDIVITGNDVDKINEFKVFLISKFLIKDLGELKYFLGIEVLKTNKGICLSQRKYCLELLNDYGLLGCKPMSTPIEPNVSINCDPTDKDPLLVNVTEYQKLVGRLIYLTLTRPDISFTVHVLSQYMHAPLHSHLNLAFRTLIYLKREPGKGLHLVRSNNFNLHAYCDSDWAKCKMNRKSVSGYLVYLCGSLVSWKSKKQSVVSRSSAEAEFRAMAVATCEIIWIMNLLSDFNIKVDLRVELFCDNSSAIQISANPMFHEKTRHFDIDLHYLREKISTGIVKSLKSSIT
ncbi:uncharacterized mitochondrial protein AtMg00810-like [Rutidosis leptorrhynchoides]|uniref:uncharacterized mitochondrial protein AtMg00810-like n=1 Tax=Rutidosis leptorrhynchoides TaxID=125765 RepID=UPI003A9997FF